MDILGGRRFVEIPGDRLHELPPLLVRSAPGLNRLERVMDLAGDIVDSEEMLSDTLLAGLPPDLAEAEMERRRLDLALNLVDQYQSLMRQWSWGDSILEWIRQCEITFETRADLRPLLRGDVWPHAGRSSFVILLEDKAVKAGGVDLQRAVGLRLTYRQPPPIGCFSNQFLFYLNGTLAATAYMTWANLTPGPLSALPPERFTFDVVTM